MRSRIQATRSRLLVKHSGDMEDESTIISASRDELQLQRTNFKAERRIKEELVLQGYIDSLSPPEQIVDLSLRERDKIILEATLHYYLQLKSEQIPGLNGETPDESLLRTLVDAIEADPLLEFVYNGHPMRTLDFQTESKYQQILYI